MASESSECWYTSFLHEVAGHFTPDDISNCSMCLEESLSLHFNEEIRKVFFSLCALSLSLKKGPPQQRKENFSNPCQNVSPSVRKPLKLKV